MKTIGLLGGMSWESSIEYERLINEGICSHAPSDLSYLPRIGSEVNQDFCVSGL